MGLETILKHLECRAGHFALESGHHSGWWLCPDRLFYDPERLGFQLDYLTRKLWSHRPQAICGSGKGGGQLARLIATRLLLPAYVGERIGYLNSSTYLPARYRLSAAHREALAGKTVAVVDDVISKGSSARALVSELVTAGAHPIVMGGLFVLGDVGTWAGGELKLPLESVHTVQHGLWQVADCPLCRVGAPIERILT
jgi:orotate phosphoribosyltransferase